MSRADQIVNSAGPSSLPQIESGRDLGRVFSVLLFAVFIITVLLCIVVGTDTYRRLMDYQSSADATRLGLNLIANSVHANDETDAIGTGAGPEGRSLVLFERTENGSYETRMYLYKGQIVQEYALAGSPYTPDKATPVVESQSFDFSYNGGLLTVFTDQGSVDVALRSERGGA
ncbi:MAG: DUF4860 domain-containing protein [Atopobiaceae bacterium]|nr:DUF4860 domain-containing protein [Atopobiaceae bacterium]